MNSQIQPQPSQHSEQPAPEVSVKKSPSTMVLLVLAFFIVFVAVGSYALGMQKRVSTTQVAAAPTVIQPTPTISPVADWLTYEDSSIHFSLKYPQSWNLEELRDKGVVDGVDLKGKEGNVHAAWGSGFGGGCDEQYHENLTIFGRSRSICRIVKADGTESWNQIYEDRGTSGTFGAYATANAPYQTNRDTILQILSTFTFTDVAQAVDTANWRTYSYKSSYFEYPSDWTVTTIDYFNTRQIMKKKKTVRINISDQQYPYGFEGPDQNNDTQKSLFVTVEGKQYKVNEVTHAGKSVFVDFVTNNDKKHYILFGTGYPAAIDDKASIEDYNVNRETILKIISTIQFKQ